jgi:hypothetical protein
MKVIFLMSVLLVARNVFFPAEVYAFYASGSFALRVNTVLGRCVSARARTLDAP